MPSIIPSILHQVDSCLSFQSQPRCLCSVKLLDPPVFPSFHPCVPLEDFPGGSEVKNPSANAGDKCSIPGLGRSPGGGHGYPVQYSCLENPMDRSLVGYSPWGRKELDTTEQLHFPFDPDGFMYVFQSCKLYDMKFAPFRRKGDIFLSLCKDFFKGIKTAIL